MPWKEGEAAPLRGWVEAQPPHPSRERDSEQLSRAEQSRRMVLFLIDY